MTSTPNTPPEHPESPERRGNPDDREHREPPEFDERGVRGVFAGTPGQEPQARRGYGALEQALGWAALVGPFLLLLGLVTNWPNINPVVAVLVALGYVALVTAYAAVSFHANHQPVVPMLTQAWVAALKWLALLAVLFGCVVTPLGWVVMPPVVLLLAIVLASPGGLRSQRVAVVMGYVRQAVDLNLPLPSMLGAVARSERGLVRLRLTDLAREVSAGQELPAALQIAVPELTVREAALLAAAQRSGRLPQALGRLVQQRSLPTPSRLMDRGIVMVYPVLILLIVTLGMTFFMIFIVPKFEKIFEDFNTTLPPLTTFIISSSRWLGGTLTPTQRVPGLFWVLLALLVAALFRVAVKLGAFAGPLGFILWVLPGWRGYQRDRGLGDICHVLGEATAAGVAPLAALNDVAQLPVNVVLRRRVERWIDATSGGATLAEGARLAHMPPMLVGVLAAGEMAAEVPAALTMLVRCYDYRLARNRAVFQSAMVPVMVLALAALVGTVVVAFFLPLVKLIALLA